MKTAFIPLIISLAILVSGCSVEGIDDPAEPIIEATGEKVILLNEGNYMSDNGQLSLIEDHIITNGWFRTVNGTKIGDTPTDIIPIKKDLLAITVNYSGIIHFIKSDGTLTASVEDIPNCRYMATDGTDLYVTSYAHTTALGENYTKGYVAKISLEDYRIKSTCEVGYEPEGIAYYKGKLYVANSGGYAYSESHDYENTVSVIDASTMTITSEIHLTDENGIKLVNLYGKISQCDKYLCINVSGDYMALPPATVILNCENGSYKVYDFPATYSTVSDGNSFFVLGSSFSYETYLYEYSMKTIDPFNNVVTDGYCAPDGESSANDVAQAVESMESPYGIYQNPYTRHLYITDAGDYSSAGRVYEFDAEGTLIGDPMKCYICPGKMVALP